MKREANIFDKIGTLIPGYRGYQEREGRRECDRQLREKIADRLSDIEKQVENVIEKSNIEDLKKGETVRKEINNLIGLIKYSPYGESAFFSNSVIKEPELDKIYQIDLQILDMAIELGSSIESPIWSFADDKAELLRKAINERNRFIKDL